MSSGGDGFDDPINEEVLRIILGALNGATLMMTVFNWYHLRQGFKNLKFYDRDRRNIRVFFYSIVSVPLLCAGCAHFGARFPKYAIWIFPAMQIFLAMNFFWFLQMLYHACGGYNNVRDHLQAQVDRCGFPRMERRSCKLCRCFMRANAWRGLKFRMVFLYLVYVRPIFALTISAFERSNMSPDRYVYLILRSFVLICTMCPLQGIKCFQSSLEPLSRMTRITPKVNLIRIMVPMIQVQQIVISWMVGEGMINDLHGIKSDFRGSRIEGLLLSFEMLFISMFSYFIYRAEDIQHWEHRQQAIWIKQPIYKDTMGTEDEEEAAQRAMDDSQGQGHGHGSHNNSQNNHTPNHLLMEFPVSELSGVSAYSSDHPPHDLNERDLTLPEEHSISFKSLPDASTAKNTNAANNQSKYRTFSDDPKTT